jgi:hypothetical protein
MALFTLGAFLEFVMNPGIIGPNEFLVKLYYLTVAPQVSLLGTGVLLLISPRWGRRILAVVLTLSAMLVILGSVAPIDISQTTQSFQKSVVFGISDAARAFSRPVRLLTVGLNIYGAIALIGGSLFSFLRDRHRTFALLIAVGGLLNAIGGTLLGILGDPEIFLEFELLGAVALFAGFLMSYRITKIARTGKTITSTGKGPVSLPSSRRYALAAVFGAIIFASKAFAPTPMKNSIIVIQALLLGLGALLLMPLGATLVATIGGLLTASYTSQLGLFTITFAVLYGLLIDGLVRILKARTSETEISAHRFALAITLSTAVIGFIAYGTTIALGLLPRNPPAEMFILVGGVLSGLMGGYLDVVIWRRAARYFA